MAILSRKKTNTTSSTRFQNPSANRTRPISNSTRTKVDASTFRTKNQDRTGIFGIFKRSDDKNQESNSINRTKYQAKVKIRNKPEKPLPIYVDQVSKSSTDISTNDNDPDENLNNITRNNIEPRIINNTGGANSRTTELRQNALLRKIRSIGIIKILQIAIFSTLAVLIIIFLTKSDFLNIKIINILSYPNENIQYLDSQQIEIELSHLVNTNYFTVDIQSEISRIQDSYNYVNAIYFEKHFPDSISVYIQEKQPFITAIINDESCIVIATDDTVLEIEQSTADCVAKSQRYNTVLIELSGHPLDYYLSGKKFSDFIVDSVRKIQTTVNVNNYILSKITIQEDFSTVELNGERKLLLVLRDDIDEQLLRFSATITELKSQFKDFKSLDLRYKRPVIK